MNANGFVVFFRQNNKHHFVLKHILTKLGALPKNVFLIHESVNYT